MDFNEFEESEVMFSDDYSSDQSVESENDDPGTNRSDGSMKMMMNANRRKCPKKKARVMNSSSAPVNIPETSMMSSFKYGNDDLASYQPFDEFNNDDQMMKMPPHLIIERRDNEEIARSFSPLKGKHLCQVRNSILRMTGFLER